MRLLTTEEKQPGRRCWFCRTDKSVKYGATMINVNPSPRDTRRYMEIYVCNKCALNHANDFIEEMKRNENP
jgi:hypothetical protein